MDLLSQYKQEHPEAFQEKKPSPLTDAYGREYAGMVAFVMRASGGRIKDARQAHTVLFVGIISAFAIAGTVLFFVGRPAGKNLEDHFPPGSSVLVP